MRYLLLAIFSFPTLFLYPQTAQDTALLKTMADSAFNLMYVSMDSARAFSLEVREMAREKGILSYELDAWQTYAYTFFYQYEFDKALEIFEEALNKAKEAESPSLESKFYNSLAMVHEQKGDLALALDHYKKSLALDRQQNDSAGLSITLGNTANAYESVGKIDSAIALQKEAIGLREGREDAKVHTNYNNLATIYHQMGRYDRAIELYLKAADKRKELGEENLEAQTYGNLGVLFSNLNSHDKSIFYAEKALAIFEKLDLSREMASNFSVLGSEYLRIMDYRKAESFFQKAIDLHKKTEDRKGESIDLNNLGSIYLEEGKLDKAIQYSRKSLELKEEIEYDLGLANSMINLGTALSRKNPGREAEKLLLDAKTKAEAQSNLQLQSMATEHLAEHYERIGNLSKALEYQRISNSFKDSTFNKDYIDKMNQLYVAFETEQANKDLLQEQLKSQELEKEKAESELLLAQRNNQLLMSLGIFLLLGLGAGFVFYRNKQNERNKIASIRIEEQQKGLSAIIQAQENERKRIAKDLHDGIVQQLGGLKLGLQKVLGDEQDSDSKRMIKLLDDSTQDLRELSHKMMPRALSELGLIPALDDMLSNSLGHTEIKYEFEHFGIKSEERFTESIEISLYRIVQELINNVIKHSGASQVQVQLIKTGNDLALIVEDNGSGFNKGKEKKGMGLMNISSRLDTLNGKVNFEASPEGGTLATIKIPLS